MKNEKLMKKTKGIDKILKILETLILVAMAIMAVGIIVIAISKPDMMPNALTFGFIKLTLNNGTMIDEIAYKTSNIFTLISGLFLGTLSYISIKVIRKIIAPMIIGLPFEKGISQHIRKYGFLVLIAGGLKTIVNLVDMILINRAVLYENIFNMENISSINFQYDISFNFVIFAAVIFLISIIFEYGEELQIESDETL